MKIQIGLRNSKKNNELTHDKQKIRGNRYKDDYLLKNCCVYLLVLSATLE